MSRSVNAKSAYVFHPLTSDRWRDLERLFGERGACGGCWCMWWRSPAAEFSAKKGEGNRKALRALVKAGAEPGILAYAGGEPVGWCAIAPRDQYPRLARSRVLAPVDDAPVWSITCLFVDRRHRRRGLSRKLLEAAVRFAAERGARLVEGYPTDPVVRQADAFVFTGIATAFEAAGFEEVARRSTFRPILRRAVRPRRSGGARTGRPGGRS